MSLSTGAKKLVHARREKDLVRASGWTSQREPGLQASHNYVRADCTIREVVEGANYVNDGDTLLVWYLETRAIVQLPAVEPLLDVLPPVAEPRVAEQLVIAPQVAAPAPIIEQPGAVTPPVAGQPRVTTLPSATAPPRVITMRRSPKSWL